jgi:osomolarity two-component system sensor histidine kinase NIK1
MFVIPPLSLLLSEHFSHVLGAAIRQVNWSCSSLTDQVQSIAQVTTAVAKGDLTRKIEVQVNGEMATLKTSVNSMVDQLRAFASEVARAVFMCTEGYLSGQVHVATLQGTWADLNLDLNVSFCLLPLFYHPY